MNATSSDLSAVPHAWTHALPPLVLRGRRVLPIVQGGMGVGISAHRLAGSVAQLGAVGTIASVDLRRGHADLMAASAHADKAPSIPRTSRRSIARSAARKPLRKAEDWSPST